MTIDKFQELRSLLYKIDELESLKITDNEENGSRQVISKEYFDVDAYNARIDLHIKELRIKFEDI